MNRKIITALAFLTAAAVISACTGLALTNARWRMDYMVNEYFDPEAGVYPSLDDHIFGLKTRVTGALKAKKFAEEIGFWIFLTEPHQPKRIPVLMVHGHWTGPRMFQDVVGAIDTTRFEPWLTYYPTGMDLPELGSMLRHNLARLSEYYGQKEVVVIAYSMGGLTIRQALRPYEDGLELPTIPAIIGIANPWGGTRKVAVGNKMTVIAKNDREDRVLFGAKSWLQIIENSEYLDGLFDDPLPPETAFHMIYGLGGDDDFIPGRDDGSLSEDSLARPEAVTEARSVTVIEDADHQNIVAHPRTLERIREILEEVYQSIL